LPGGGGGESDEGDGDFVDGELIVDDEDDEDWDDGLELDLPSTQKKLKVDTPQTLDPKSLKHFAHETRVENTP
jgi:hypothetical protein